MRLLFYTGKNRVEPVAVIGIIRAAVNDEGLSRGFLNRYRAASRERMRRRNGEPDGIVRQLLDAQSSQRVCFSRANDERDLQPSVAQAGDVFVIGPIV